MRYMTKTSLLATGLAFALTGAAFAQGAASSTAPAQGSRPAAQAPAKPGEAATGQVRGHQGNGQTRAVTPAAPSGGATR
ncbi:MAG: hypothetical protein INF97_02285 [Roseomonas sp.]|nr:hypothetical protein [Roseomonas sp.]